ncbi:MAG: Protocatechuate 3,4-dioxygenase alpha chain (EC [uncultured Paraburkholderia sp.]|nr:MAG: Protocatechuate 3,4-dioxygenase alpha chain (EC [uncultured Paraburkholderia sp.]CAH2808683.1 MAG: Protocatechuate 3,4-dioxygenase alpha chain (EC [uncultured Paraburkholderia sp.]CAH2943713.1 MAG: Protocatechuate 3,4-dioxygenase alpha chain (EC [uncultured Paraburkholderia sp.]CAH2944486.1 MAG: Protocatechuate 3,4-dioxygenase alpha chain (EC [uncultured Paraburkholderia sp.]
MTTLKQTPSQTVGPYFAYGLCPQQYDFDFKSLFTPVLADREAAGEHITLVGQVFDGDGNSIGDAMLEVSQVDANGRYPESREEILKTGFRGFARVGTGTDPHKHFVVETIKPGRVSADEAPHLNAIVTMRGMLLHTFTRIYFEDEAEANARDPVLTAVPADRRDTLIARRDPNTANVYRFDIHMQGDKETVFFDL